MSHRQLFDGIKAVIEDDKPIDELDHFLHGNFVRHGQRAYDIAEYKEMIQRLRTAFPDLNLVESDRLEAEDFFVHRWKREGHHRGAFHGVPPTGKKVSATGITISRVEDGLIVEEWAAWNELQALHSVGIVPATF